MLPAGDQVAGHADAAVADAGLVAVAGPLGAGIAHAQHHAAAPLAARKRVVRQATGLARALLVDDAGVADGEVPVAMAPQLSAKSSP